MDIATIRKLANIMRDTNLTALELEEGETRIRLESNYAPAQPLAPAPAAQAPTVVAAAAEPGLDFNDMKAVTSPLVGVFYAAPAPDAAPYVRVGDKVKKGDVLCIVEAMKLMNEIVSEHDGEIVDIMVNNGDVVEFGQILFKIV